MENYQVDILSQNGKFSLVGQNGADFPTLPSIQKGKGNKVGLSNEAMLTGINKTLFATADDELRPVMNGIFIEISPEEMCFVASDAHKLVRYKRMDVETKVTAAFILPKKPASLLKNLLPKEMGEISLEFDEKNAIISGAHFKLICRLVEGNYPAYNTVIPQNNPNRMVIDRVEFYNTLRRVSVFSNPATNLVRLKISGNEVNISAQDIDFAISAYERVNCAYEGDPMEIGFKSVFLLEILSNISSSDIAFQLSDPTRAGIIVPAEHDNENEDVLMLLMPMMLTDL
jgi:DNA polymerase-3 subunit beta